MGPIVPFVGDLRRDLGAKIWLLDHVDGHSINFGEKQRCKNGGKGNLPIPPSTPPDGLTCPPIEARRESDDSSQPWRPFDYKSARWPLRLRCALRVAIAGG